MSKSKSVSKSQVASKKVVTGNDYEVGYGKPPLHTRFKKGRSGNKAGSRKKLTVLDIRQQVQDIFIAPVLVRDGKKTRRPPKIIALIEQKLNEAFKDPNGRSLPKLLQLAQQFQIFNIKKVRKIDFSALTDEERELYFDLFIQLRPLLEKTKQLPVLDE